MKMTGMYLDVESKNLTLFSEADILALGTRTSCGDRFFQCEKAVEGNKEVAGFVRL